MNDFTTPRGIRGVAAIWLAFLLALALAACGGGGGGGGGDAPPSISAQPSSASSVSGASATFSVTATGDALVYQWQRSTDANATAWIDIVGATGASYVITAVDATLNGIQFRATISNTAATVTTSAVTLTVTPAFVAPVITVQPADSTVVAGANASFSVTATGSALAYQWQSSADGATWTNVSGATGTTLTLATVAVIDSGKRVRAVVSNSAGSVNTNAALLTVNPASLAPTITAQPAPASVVAPQTATFTVVASGSPSPTYQWQLSLDGGTTFADIGLATDASYTTAATTAADSGKRFRVRVANSVGSVLSVAVALTVNPAQAPPGITTQPISQTVVAPATATFSVVASGTPTPSYQWQLSTDGGASFSNINAATATTYTTPATTVADSGKRYRVQVSNSAGTSTSQAATLTVNAANPAPGGASTSCAPSGLLTAGTTVQTTSSISSNPALSLPGGYTVVGPAVFQGRAASEVDVTLTLDALQVSIRSFFDYDAATALLTTYGSLVHSTSASVGITVDSTVVATPAVVIHQYALASGQSTTYTVVSQQTDVTTINGVAQPPETSTSTTTTSVQFLGTETLTTPAGTFNTCKYVETEGSTVTTSWNMVGYGIAVRSISAGVTTTLTSVKVNGAALTQFP